MPYVPPEGSVPVPAERCTTCAGPLEAAAPDGADGGWFTPSPLDATIWYFRAPACEAQGTAEKTLGCGACGLRFRLYPLA